VNVPETQDAARRTRLANERTYLAWWRTGLAAFAVCIGLGRIVPGVTKVTSWPYQTVGAAYGVLGVICMIIGHMRIRSVEKAIDRGEYARLDTRIGMIMLVLGVGLGVATVALVIFGG
jgi:putative membrane protein